MTKKLAIIIPAYKSEFLKATLDSLSKQTNLNFKVYIGDDNSPFELLKIVEQFKTSLDITYKKFDNNLGAESLTKQWERCVEMSSEEWIWLFSDDDLISNTCIETFYKAQNGNPGTQFFKFHTKMIDFNGDGIKLFRDRTNLEQKSISSESFINDRITNNRFRSYAIEYVFHRTLFDQFRFINFPLAWSSDDATWFKYSIANSGISVLNDTVFWRFSGKNISSDSTNKVIIFKKYQAIKEYLNWLDQNIKQFNINLDQDKMLYWYFNQYYALFKTADKSVLKKELEHFAFTINDVSFQRAYSLIKKEIKKEKIKKMIKFFLNK